MTKRRGALGVGLLALCVIAALIAALAVGSAVTSGDLSAASEERAEEGTEEDSTEEEFSEDESETSTSSGDSGEDAEDVGAGVGSSESSESAEEESDSDAEPDDSATEALEDLLGGSSSQDLESLLGEEASELLSYSRLTNYESERSVVEESADLLEEYEQEGESVVAQAGYLDFLGRTWGCVLQGDGWVEICVVTEADDGDGCSVFIWHMDAEDAEEALL